MKAKKLLSWFGVLIIMIGTVIVMAGCNQANDNKGDNGNTSDGLYIQPTGEADPALIGLWVKPNSKAAFSFDRKGNIVSMNSLYQSVYTVKGFTVSFDFVQSMKAFKVITIDSYINFAIAEKQKRIVTLEELLNTSENPEMRKEYEEEIKKAKEKIQEYKNMTQKEKDDWVVSMNGIKEEAKALEAYAKFEGTLNADKTELTIEKFPLIEKDFTCKVERVVFKKR